MTLFTKVTTAVVGAAARTLTGAKSDSRLLAEKASAIVIGGIKRKLLNQMAAPGAGIGSRKSFVTDTTHKQLNEIIPDKISFTQTPPFQEEEMCEIHANKVLTEQRKKYRASIPPVPNEDSPLDQVVAYFEKLLCGSHDSDDIKSAKELLDIYQRNGGYVLRGPGLSDQYRDHAVAVVSALKINTPSGPKTVLTALDCNDMSTDARTNASRKTAERLGKGHISELSHEEANKNGAQQQRIRFLEAESLARKMANNYSLYQMMLSNAITAPKVIYHKTEGVKLSPGEDAELGALLEEIYDEEVEKFESDESPLGTKSESKGEA
jgi:hypothetical protein